MTNIILPRARLQEAMAAMRASIVRHCQSPAPESRTLGERLQEEYLRLIEALARFDALHDLWGWTLEPEVISKSPPLQPAPSKPNGKEELLA